MEWYNILCLVLGALGGTAGLVSIYHAKSHKDTIDINNMQEMLDEALSELDGNTYYTVVEVDMEGFN
jgi:hypothetical protein